MKSRQTYEEKISWDQQIFAGSGIKILMGSITKQYTSLGPCEVAEEREGKFRSVKAGYRLKINNNKISAYLK